MTTPAPTIYGATLAERAAAGPWPAFLAAFDELLDAFRRNDAARLEHARHDVAELRAQLAAGGVAVPAVTRRVPSQPVARSLRGFLDR